jgi:hypothetical protein
VEGATPIHHTVTATPVTATTSNKGKTIFT